MTTQATNNVSNDNPIVVFSKSVKEDKINRREITRNIDKRKIFNIIDSLINDGETKNLNELELNENRREWLDDLLFNFPRINEQNIRYLINDFTDSMKTRMREEDKYAIGILSNKGLFLCHSILGEETITKDWQVIERMLDKDNVLRFVYFKREDTNIKVVYYETYRSESLVDWLGLPEKEASYYFGGKTRIYTKINELDCILELRDEDIESILDEKRLEIVRNLLVLSNPVEQLQIIQVRVGRKKYKKINDFLQDFLAERYDLKHYTTKYKEINEKITPYIHKFIDDIDCVIKKEGKEEKRVLFKRNPNFYILFINENIDIRESFLDEIYTKLLNKETIKIFHAGTPFLYPPLQISSIQFFNQLKVNEITKPFIEKYKNVEILDKTLDRIMLYCVFDMLKKENEEEPIKYLFEKINGKISEDIDISKQLITKENNLIEYKSSDFFNGNNEEIIKRFKEDIESKLEGSPIKIYIIGFDEKTQQFYPIQSSRANHDRLFSIEQKLRKLLNIPTIHFIPIPLNDGRNCILTLIVSKATNSSYSM